jgi:hypothetical protein
MKKILLIAVISLFVLVGCAKEPLIGGCGTVTPGLEDACCARFGLEQPQMKCAGMKCVQCEGAWKWNREKARCELVCGAKIESFEECKAAGNPIMESYPRQCRAGNQTFGEEISPEEDGRKVVLHGEQRVLTEEECKARYGRIIEQKDGVWHGACDVQEDAFEMNGYDSPHRCCIQHMRDYFPFPEENE